MGQLFSNSLSKISLATTKCSIFYYWSRSKLVLENKVDLPIFNHRQISLVRLNLLRSYARVSKQSLYFQHLLIFNAVTKLWGNVDSDRQIVLYRGWSHFVDNEHKSYHEFLEQIRNTGSWSNCNFNTILRHSNINLKQLWKSKKKLFFLGFFPTHFI